LGTPVRALMIAEHFGDPLTLMVYETAFPEHDG
jgi:hypothetical protein